jgi:hypothetical protein
LVSVVYGKIQTEGICDNRVMRITFGPKKEAMAGE